jgi:hypothetical protein
MRVCSSLEMNCINTRRVEVWYDPTQSKRGSTGLDKDSTPEMKSPIYLARKDAEYHILRISINGFMEVLEGLRVDNSGKSHNCYLEFRSCFLVNLWLLVLHGSRADITGANMVPCTRHRKQTRAS